MAGKFRFVHMADVHLGKQQYGRPERAVDFARAYADVIGYAVENRVDFVLIAGDLFEQKTVDPETFNVAATGLRRLADAGIPVFAIEGNHDKFLRHGARTWIWYLERQGLLHLLDITRDEDGIGLRPWRPETGGTYFDLNGVRIFGIGYYGARLPEIVRSFASRAADLPSDGIQHSICLLHTGVDDKTDYLHSGCTASELMPLRGLIDYVALGHVHHAFSLPDGAGEQPFLFCPGALENWSTREVGERKGFYDVTVDPAASPRQQARLITEVAFSRRYLKLALDVDRYDAPAQLAEAVADLAEAYADRRLDRPIVELRLSGLLRFERGLVDLKRYEEILRGLLDCLVARVILDTESRPAGQSTPDDLQQARGEIERTVLEQMFARYDEFAPHAAELAAIATRIKAQAIAGDPPEAILESLTFELERAGVIDADN